MNPGIIVAIVFASLLFIFLLTIILLLPKKAFFNALFSGVYISVFKAISMKLRNEKVQDIISSYVISKKSHLGVSLYELEVVSISGGHPLKIIEGLISARNARVKMDFPFAKSIDVAGFDVLEVVRTCVNPKVIELPLITSVAQDNLEINVKISLTLKVVIENFLRGVTEETISARAVEAVVTKIANTGKASFLVSQPQLIDKAIFAADIDLDGKYKLVSADVIHVDLGNNRGLSLEKEQIEKNRIIASNQLEYRRLNALALEQEMKAKAAEERLKIIENEAEIPKAVVQAIKDGKMKDVVDYYKLQNLQADTEMRRNLFSKKGSSNK